MGNSRSGFINSVYIKNEKGFVSNNHNLTVDVEKFDIDYTKISFEPTEKPYLKLALVDRHLEELGY